MRIKESKKNALIGHFKAEFEKKILPKSGATTSGKRESRPQVPRDNSSLDDIIRNY
ncbi:MAG: hypothetical protein AB7S78_06355 [Candidatus Omnitrophota bacterium]